jgi:zinc/manganese transport system substrate-binding protein
MSRLLLLAASLAALAGGLRAQDPLKVVTTVPDLASLTRTIGGDRVEVESFVRPGDDPHAVIAKPSMLLKLSRADAVVVMGRHYEHSFMPALLQKVRNPRVRPGGAGYLELGSLIEPLEVPEKLDRGQGADLHPLGNPHFHLDPENGRIMAAAIRDHFVALMPDHAAEIEARWKAWDEDAAERIAAWAERLAPIRGARILTYHNSWPYFARRFGLVVLDHVEPKPGLPPTAGHLARLVREIQDEEIHALLMEPWYDERRVAALAASEELHILRVATTCGVGRDSEEYLDHLGVLVEELARAHGLD